MIKNIYLELEYDGTNYYGWQIQNKRKKLTTIQGKLQQAIRKVFHTKISVIYSGRTDRGVHAKVQTVNFTIDTKIPAKDIREAINTYLPRDIYIKKVKFVPLDFHSRLSAKSKTYRYFILNTKDKDTFLRNYSWWIPKKLNVDLMRKTSSQIVGNKDFAVFAKECFRYQTTVRCVKRIEIKKDKNFVYIDIQADGFLMGMVRSIISLIVNVGLGNINSSQIAKIIKTKNRVPLKRPAPAQGLYLWKVYY